MLKNHLLIAWRSLLRNKLFSLINILGLAIGMAACLLIIQFVSFELSFDRFHERLPDLYRVVSSDDEGVHFYAVSQPVVGPALKENFPEVELATRFFPRRGTVQFAQNGRLQSYKEANYAYADTAFFSTFSFITDTPDGLKEPFSIMLSASRAKHYFNDASPIGHRIRLYDDFGEIDYTVRGVFEDMPANSQIQLDFLVSMHQLEEELFESRGVAGWRSFLTYIRLTPGTNPDQLEARFPMLVAQLTGEESREQFSLQPMQDIHLHSDLPYDRVIKGDVQLVYFLSILAVFILILAWVNYVNLSTARSLDRAREVGIRKVLGSTRSELVRQFLGESLLINAFGLIGGITLAKVAAPILQNWIDPATPIYGLTSIPLLYLLMLITFFLLGALVAGMYPAWLMASYPPAEVVQHRRLSGREGGALRKALVVFQFAISVLLLTATISVYQQLRYMQTQNLGLDIDKTYVLERPEITDSTFTDRMEILQQQLSQIPAVSAVIGSGVVPGGNFNFGTRVRGKQQAPEGAKVAEIAYVQPGFFVHYDIPVLLGRSFSQELVTDRSTAVVNQAFLAMLGLPMDSTILGYELLLGNEGPGVPIIGVVRNYHNASLRYEIEPVVFHYQPVINYLSLRLQTNASSLAPLLKEIREAYLAIFPGNPYEAYFLDEIFEQQYEDDRRLGKLIALFGGLSMLIAILGLFGLSLFTARQRTKEIGIRKVCGASVADIMKLLTKFYLRLVLIAATIALPLSVWGLWSWLENFASRMPVNLLLFIIPVFVVLLISALVVLGQTWKAARANPVEALRDE